MKNKFIVLMLAIGTLVVSCSDAYDVEQKGQVNDPYAAYKNADDVSIGINAVYASIPGETEVEFVSTFTDEISIGVENGGQGIISGEYAFRMEPGNDYAIGIWNAYYGMINRINRLEVINKKLQAENKNATTKEAEKYNDNLGELYALRAFAHYKLFSYFTPDYKAANGLSIINLEFVPPTDYNFAIGRNTVSEVVKFIEDDLARAEELHKGAWGDFNYANPGFINAIKVKLYAMTGDYDKVIQYGTEIMKVGAYALAPTSEYLQIFPRTQLPQNKIETPAKEIIFQLKRTQNNGGNVAAAWYSGNVSIDGSPFYEMGRSLYNELDALDQANFGKVHTTTNDVRYEVNLDNSSKIMTSYATASQSDYESGDILLIGKYQGISFSGATLRNTIPIFRSSDILLAMAEARANQHAFEASSTDPDDLLNDYSSVYSILYNIRYYRAKSYTGITMPTITNEKNAFDAILKERRVEFAFEGHRYLDMKRLGTKSGSEGFTRYSKDCFVNGACNLPANDFKMTLPIPVREMSGNHVIKALGQQNPGY